MKLTKPGAPTLANVCSWLDGQMPTKWAPSIGKGFIYMALAAGPKDTNHVGKEEAEPLDVRRESGVVINRSPR